jgi:hypothetical protein
MRMCVYLWLFFSVAKKKTVRKIMMVMYFYQTTFFFFSISNKIVHSSRSQIRLFALIDHEKHEMFYLINRTERENGVLDFLTSVFQIKERYRF